MNNNTKIDTTKRINPAILVETFEELQVEVDALLQITNEFDIDLIDWKRSPKKTVKAIEAIELNRFVELNFDVMMDDPRETVEILIKSGAAKRITINLESDFDVLPLIKAIKTAGIQPGVSLNPETNIQDAVKYFPYVDLIQIMTIQPGVQGNPFLSSRLSATIELRDLGFDGLIEIDGGVTFDKIPLVKKYPINILSVGSSFSKDPDPSTVYKEMTELLNSN